MAQTFTKASPMPCTAEVLFAWHGRDGAFERLNPPWEPAKVVSQSGGLADGRVELRVPMGPASVTWVAQHEPEGFIDGRQFRDVQAKGPFARWSHTHRCEPDGDASILQDQIEFALPMGPVGRTLSRGSVRRKLGAVFGYRHRVTAADVAAHLAAGVQPMHVLISGASGLIGSALTPLLTTGGHRVTTLTRAAGSEDAVAWSPMEGRLAPDDIEGVDAVVHLAGESIVGRWSAAKKRRIRDSRVIGTQLLAETLARLDRKPKVLVTASAIGFYGDRGDAVLTEQSPRGEGFLADVCEAWEQAADPAREAGIRTVHARFGVVLSPRGGALAKSLTPFKLGGGGAIGSGRQYWSWITLDDAIGAVHHALTRDAIEGPMNVVAPNPVTNLEFTKALGRVLRRPTVLPMPGFAAKLAFGEMANELLLSSTRVDPSVLESTEYAFRCDELEDGLRHVLGRPHPGATS